MRCLIWLTPAQHFQTFCQSIKGSKWRLIFIADAFPPHFSPIRKENLKKAKQRQRNKAKQWGKITKQKRRHLHAAKQTHQNFQKKRVGNIVRKRRQKEKPHIKYFENIFETLFPFFVASEVFVVNFSEVARWHLNLSINKNHKSFFFIIYFCLFVRLKTKTLWRANWINVNFVRVFI